MSENEQTVKRALFWNLVHAYVLDGIILIPIMIFVAYLLSLLALFEYEQPGLGWLLAVLISYLSYFTIAEGGWKRSYGKAINGIFIQVKKFAWERIFIAYLIDFCIVTVVYLLILDFFDSRRSSWHTGDAVAMGMGVLITAIPVILCYFAGCDHFLGGTLGKKLMGLQVVQAVPQKQKEETK